MVKIFYKNFGKILSEGGRETVFQAKNGSFMTGQTNII